MKAAVIGYLPPPRVGNAQAAYENFTRFRTAHPLMLYSDHPYPNTIRIKNPERVGRYPNGMAISNLIFLTGVHLAMDAGYDHFLYLENDCRVASDEWDRKPIDEFREGAAVGGTICYLNAERSRLPEEPGKFSPVNHHSSQRPQTCIFAMGALAVYSAREILDVFGSGPIEDAALRSMAWDMELGYRLWSRYREECYQRIQPLRSIYSWWGNRRNSEADRREALLSGRFTAVHQIKSNWNPTNN